MRPSPDAESMTAACPYHGQDSWYTLSAIQGQYSDASKGTYQMESLEHEDEEGSVSQEIAPASYWGIFKTWLPLALTKILNAAEGPMCVAVIMRLSFSTLELGALYSYAWPVLAISSSMVYTLCTVGNVFGTNVENLRKSKIMSLFLGTISSLVLCIFVFTPFGRYFLSEVMAVPDVELEMSLSAIKVLCIYPILCGINLVHQGILIRSGYANQILISRVIRIFVVMLVLLVGLETQWFQGAVLGGLAVLVPILFQSAYVILKSQKVTKELKLKPIELDVAKTSKLITFTVPLLIAPILASITVLIMAAAMGRLPGVVVSLAIWPVVVSFSNIGLGMGQTFDQVTVKHYQKHQDRIKLFRFAMILGLALSVVVVLLIINGVFHYVLRALEDISQVDSEISIHVMWFLAAQPLLYTLCAYYGGLLAKIKRTIPILLARVFSLLIITSILLATVNMDPFSGVYVVACSSCIGSLVTLFWLRYSWKKMIPKLQEDLTFIKI